MELTRGEIKMLTKVIYRVTCSSIDSHSEMTYRFNVLSQNKRFRDNFNLFIH